MFNGAKTTNTYYEGETTTVHNLSPELLVASSYGQSGYRVPWDQAAMRCASYQEYGYPAGRWRLPTPAECLFANYLSSQGVIPSLFYNRYWTSVPNVYYYNGNVYKYDGTNAYLINFATGEVTTTRDTGFQNPPVNGQTGGANMPSSRCVYDKWYWGENNVADYVEQFTYDTTTDTH